MLSRPPQITTLTPAQAASLNFNLKRRVGRLNRPHWATPWNRSIPWSDRHSTNRRRNSTTPLAGTPCRRFARVRGPHASCWGARP